MSAEERLAAPPDEVLRYGLQSLVAKVLRGGRVVASPTRLTGGASRETWSIDAIDDAGRRHELILRRDPPTAPRPDRMHLEVELLRAAHDEGIPVPDVLAADFDTELLGAPFMLMSRMRGETSARTILSDAKYQAARSGFAFECGRILAGIHQIPVDRVPSLREFDRLEQIRAELDRAGEPHPVFELAMRWLEANRPPARAPVVVHGDFRLGNLLIIPEGICGVLDWEAARAGEAAEDLSWLSVRAWRFGGSLPVGGMGTREQLASGYASAGGRRIEPTELMWWEIAGTLRWGMGCVRQTTRYTSGEVDSIELAAIGRRACENEYDLIHLLRIQIP